MNLNLENNRKFSSHQSDNLIQDLRSFLNNTNNTTTYYSIDRFINNFAVCENLTTGEFINIPKILINKKAKPGHVIIKNKNSNKFTIDINKTKELQSEIQELAKSLFKRKS